MRKSIAAVDISSNNRRDCAVSAGEGRRRPEWRIKHPGHPIVSPAGVSADEQST